MTQFYRLITFSLFIICCITFQACQGDRLETDDPEGQSEDIPARYTAVPGKLKVLVDNSVSSYFIYRGQPKGFEYDLIERFAGEHNLQLDIKIIHEVDNILDSLHAGKGDMAAANLTITSDRLEKVKFSEPLLRTKQVLVQRLPDDFIRMSRDQIERHLIRDILDLEGDTVVVRKKSSFYDRLVNYSRETNTDIHIKPAPPDMETEQLIEMVSNGEIDYTISDENKAKLLKTYFKNIDIRTEVSLSQKIAWAVNQKAQLLLDSLNNWLTDIKGSATYNIIMRNYFEDRSITRRQIERNYETIKGGSISPYDDLIRDYATKVDWNWKLLAALINQESRFDPNTQSWAGAIGLMQVMPSTAAEFGISAQQLFDPPQNLQAGTQQLRWLKDQWETVITDSAEILKFTLASYNAGYGHVSDARRLAKAFGMQDDVWDDNVEQMLLNKSKPKYYTHEVVKYGYCRGSEPVGYVQSIFGFFELYKAFNPAM